MYDQCYNLLNPILCDCQPGLPAGQFFNITGTVNQGTNYFLVIDGYSGTTCDIKFKVNSGVGCLDLPGEPLASEIIGMDTVCAGTLQQYEFAGYENAVEVKWELDDSLLFTTNQVVNQFQIPPDLNEGIHTLKVIGRNFCGINPSIAPVTKEIYVHKNVVLNRNWYACVGEDVYFRGNLLDSGLNYIYLPTDGYCDTVVTCNVIRSSEKYGPSIKLFYCPDQDTVYYGQYAVPTSDPVYYSKMPLFEGCDSVVTFYIYPLNIGSVLHLSTDVLPTDGSEIASLDIENLDVEKTKLNFTLFNSEGIEVNPQNIRYPGTYKVDITYRAVINNNGKLDTTFCTETKFFTIDSSNVSLFSNQITQTLKIYPNPTSNSVNLELNAKYADLKTKLQINDSYGNNIYQCELPIIIGANKINIPESAFSHAGIYFVRMQSHGINFNGTIMKL